MKRETNLQLPLALDFEAGPPAGKLSVEPVSLVDFAAEEVKRRVARNRRVVKQQPPAPDPGQYVYNDPDDPRLPCDGCGFPLRPFLDYVVVRPRRSLCEDCFEDEVGLERFGVDEWLEANPLSEWHKEPVEAVLKVK